ncbi:hypothetical protein [Qipengyuania sp. MTN3-11]|uniref:hypothetical protein n=1 Tax=Qipengyuania sp. MTN3-11 TaxID=3056557 RepID=UPI0036F20BC7
MSETSFASLSSTLLARKGGAKPAMRPQSTSPSLDGKQAAAGLEDLGWNDMGDTDGDDTPARVVTLKRDTEPSSDVASPVRETIERIAERLEAPRARSATSPSTHAKTQGTKRAAFTLRLDQRRHLKLRLACTVHGKSAQALVTDALDALLAEMPEIDNLAAQVSRD